MRRLLACSLLLVVAVVTVGLVPAPPASPPASRAAAAPAGSALERRYPLGKRSLCCSTQASRTRTVAAVPNGTGVRLGPQDQSRSRRLLQALTVLLALLALAWGWMAWRFALVDGHLERRRPRRRWLVGRGTYRLARSLGFRPSTGRNALVLRPFGGRLGPVLQRRRTQTPTVLQAPWGSAESPSSTAPWLRALADSESASAGEPRNRTIDVACLPLPHPHREATLWQLTAADVHSQVAWAELVRRRGGPPQAQQVTAFVHRVAGALADAGRRLDLIVMRPGAGPAEPFRGAVLPSGVRLMLRASSDADASIAAEVHRLLVERHWRWAFTPPAAPPLDELQRQLAQAVDVHNAERQDAMHAARRARTRGGARE